MPAAVVTSERMQVLDWVKEQWQGTWRGLRLWCSQSIHKGQRWTCGETCEWQHSHNITLDLSICLCPSHRHFPKNLFKFNFPPLRDQIACMHRARWLRWTSPRRVLARAFSAVDVQSSCCIRSAQIFGSDSVRLTRRRGFVMPFLWDASQCFLSYFGEKVQDKPWKLLLASIKPPWKFKAFHKV